MTDLKYPGRNLLPILSESAQAALVKKLLKKLSRVSSALEYLSNRIPKEPTATNHQHTRNCIAMPW